MNPEELSHLNEMLERIQRLSISNSLVYDKIGLKADDREIYIPPTTHLVATVDDLTDVLDYDEATDMDEDVGSPTDNTLPTTNTGRWKATSTYDVYMVNTPNSPPRRRRRRRRGANGEPSRNNPTTDTAANDTEDPGEDL